MSTHQTLSNPRILIVDDEPANVRFLERLLNWEGYRNVRFVTSGASAIKEVSSFQPDLVVLDLHMPGVDGYEVLRSLGSMGNESGYLPTLVFTADDSRSARQKALELGAADFLAKPGETTEILLRIKRSLRLRAHDLDLLQSNADLEEEVRARTAELEDARAEIVARLAIAAEHRDDDTGQHTCRVGMVSAKIANAMGLPKSYVDLLQLAARLHDIGKIGISDSILLKPGKLTPEEYEEMKRHSEIGASILSNGRTPLLQMAERIAAGHHERYDGSGYPHGLAREAIPLEARIVAVADVFDALTHDRPYKKAWTFGAARKEIESQSGTQFDPEIVAAFLLVDVTACNECPDLSQAVLASTLQGQ